MVYWWKTHGELVEDFFDLENCRELRLFLKKSEKDMERKLTLELLRIAVKEKLVGNPDLPWKAEHWDRLEGYFEKITQAQKEKWKGNFDGDHRLIVAPDIRTAKDFLNITYDEIKAIRASKSPRKGVPESNTQDYLVRVLEYPFDKLRDFEECVIALNLHPDTVASARMNILNLISNYLRQGSDSPSEDNILEKQFAIPISIPTVAAPAKLSTSFLSRRRRVRVAATITLALGIVSVSGYTLRNLINWTGEAEVDPVMRAAPSGSPLNNFSTEGDNSPIILTPGDVQFFGGIARPYNDSSKIPEP